MNQTIYVALLEEGVPCWRPVEAQHEGGDLYLIADAPQANGETWEFQPGAAVRCRTQIFADGCACLVAFELASTSCPTPSTDNR